MSWALQSSCPWTGQSWTSRSWTLSCPITSTGTGAIYGVICNLLREVRFKKKNMLILALLPGSNKVKLHKINHYLTPIVDELLEFWSGVNLPPSEDHP